MQELKCLSCLVRNFSMNIQWNFRKSPQVHGYIFINQYSRTTFATPPCLLEPPGPPVSCPVFFYFSPHPCRDDMRAWGEESEICEIIHIRKIWGLEEKKVSYVRSSLLGRYEWVEEKIVRSGQTQAHYDCTSPIRPIYWEDIEQICGRLKGGVIVTYLRRFCPPLLLLL